MGAGQCTLGTADLLCWDGSLLCIGVRRAPPGRSWVSDTGSSSRLGGFLLCRSLRPLPGPILWYWQTSGCPAVRVCTGFLHASRQIPTETEERGPLRTLFGHPLFLCLAVLKSSSPVKQGIERRSLACEVPVVGLRGTLRGRSTRPSPLGLPLPRPVAGARTERGSAASQASGRRRRDSQVGAGCTSPCPFTAGSPGVRCARKTPPFPRNGERKLSG